MLPVLRRTYRPSGAKNLLPRLPDPFPAHPLHMVLRWSTGLGPPIALYRHVAPLERKARL